MPTGIGCLITIIIYKIKQTVKSESYCGDRHSYEYAVSVIKDKLIKRIALIGVSKVGKNACTQGVCISEIIKIYIILIITTRVSWHFENDMTIRFSYSMLLN